MPSNRSGRAKDELIALRLPADLLEAIDHARGTMSRSAWVRVLIEHAALTDDLRAAREVAAYARTRGVTIGALRALLE